MKTSGGFASKPAAISSDQLEHEINKSQQLQGHLRMLVHELEKTIGLLEQNLEQAHRSARPPAKLEEGGKINRAEAKQGKKKRSN